MEKKFYLRKLLSEKYIRKGNGIEIGPGHIPLQVLPEVKVLYVDLFSEKDLIKKYSELQDKLMTKIDIIDDGEKLIKFKNRSLDFIIANHFLEHTLNPILTLSNFLRCLKEGGIMFLAIPDRRATFDRDRPLTPSKHFIEVFKNGYDNRFDEHYIEFIRLAEKISDEQIEERKSKLIEIEYSIHFHTFQTENFVEIIKNMKDCGFPIELVHLENLQEGTDEFIAILRKNK